MAKRILGGRTGANDQQDRVSARSEDDSVREHRYRWRIHDDMVVLSAPALNQVRHCRRGKRLRWICRWRSGGKNRQVRQLFQSSDGLLFRAGTGEDSAQSRSWRNIEGLKQGRLTKIGVHKQYLRALLRQHGGTVYCG